MKKTLSNWLTTKYLMIIRNEENFEEKRTISFNYAKLLVILFFVTTVLTILSFSLVTTLLSAWFDPRTAEMEANRQVIQLSQAVDSLKNEVAEKDQFIVNIKSILAGEYEGLEEGEVPEQRGLENADQQTRPELNPIDSQFREEFEKIGTELQSIRSESTTDLQDIYLFMPLDNGIVTDEFRPAEYHYGIDVVAKKDEPVKAVADGTVIFSSWTQDTGYVIALQHRSNLISVYKHNSELLKTVGNFVSAGDIISIIGNTGDLTSGPHLHFELWYNGNPLNPSEFILF